MTIQILVEWVFKTMSLEDVVLLYTECAGDESDLYGIVVARLFKDYDTAKIIQAISDSPFELPTDIENAYKEQ